MATVGCSKDAPTQTKTNAAEPAAPAKAEADDPHAKLTNVGVDEVEKLLADKKAVPVDANSDETRSEMGTLPGAVKLSSSKSFELSELPADKSTELIFYCGSEKCRAAPKAAARAEEAGYSDVKVMSEGIRGWVKAGKPVEKS